MVNICLQYCKALSIFITKLLDFKVWTNYTKRYFCSKHALPCITKISLTEKLLEYEAKILDFLIWIICLRTIFLNNIRGRTAWAIISFDVV